MVAKYLSHTKGALIKKSKFHLLTKQKLQTKNKRAPPGIRLKWIGKLSFGLLQPSLLRLSQMSALHCANGTQPLKITPLLSKR